ncbi:hypothetical protein OF83DRAFT_1149433 [Amylostereum chailletii]|nr:hypothetical protein OF83DRAFT_1149433 [Amylostereum chailletii]
MSSRSNLQTPVETFAKSAELFAASKLQCRRWARHTQQAPFFWDLPLDVFIEILQYLPPVDLWRLSRTSGEFRATLSQPALGFIWRNACFRAKMPPARTGFTRLEWIYWLYVFDACSTPGCQNKGEIVFMIRRRLCLKCLREGFMKASYVARQRQITIPAEFLDIVLPHHLSYERSNTAVIYYAKADLEIISREWDTIRLHDTATRHAWLRKKSHNKDSVMGLAVYGHKWVEHQLVERLQELEDLKRFRKDFIYSRLRKLGFRDTDIDTVADHPEMRLHDRISEKSECECVFVRVACSCRHWAYRLVPNSGYSRAAP